jgi:hypothetical protein
MSIKYWPQTGYQIYYEYNQVKYHTDSLVIADLQVVITGNGKNLIYYAFPLQDTLPVFG